MQILALCYNWLHFFLSSCIQCLAQWRAVQVCTLELSGVTGRSREQSGVQGSAVEPRGLCRLQHGAEEHSRMHRGICTMEPRGVANWTVKQGMLQAALRREVEGCGKMHCGDKGVAGCGTRLVLMHPMVAEWWGRPRMHPY